MLNRLLVRQFDGVVVTSSFARHEFAALAGSAGTPVHQIALGVDLETFRPSSSPPAPGPPLRLVHVGRLSREKSPALAVRTALALHRRGVSLRLDVYGDGPDRGALEQLASEAPVVFHGHVSGRRTLSEHIGRADVALSVCPGETFGLAVLEALASGTPVVTADRGGARELVDSSSGGWAPPEPDALADEVLAVASRPRTSTRTAARRRAEQFGWDRTVAAMLALHGSSPQLPGWWPAVHRVVTGPPPERCVAVTRP
jgi:alpha-1,6-mannosyltransferase